MIIKSCRTNAEADGGISQAEQQLDTLIYRRFGYNEKQADAAFCVKRHVGWPEPRSSGMCCRQSCLMGKERNRDRTAAAYQEGSGKQDQGQGAQASAGAIGSGQAEG